MTVEILRRERLPHGWARYTGAVNGQKVAVRVPMSYDESLIKEALQDEAERLTLGSGSCFARD